MNEIEFLGTGTSTGIPVIGCDCDVCKSKDSRDKRLRASAIVRISGKNILIDCGPDFREQMLRAKSSELDMVLLTHSHYDHVGGIDDLRPYCYPDHFPIYAQQNVLDDLVARVPYCFSKNPYPGVPQFILNVADAEHPIKLDELSIEALPIWHHKLLINGYKIGDQLAYITDANRIENEVIDKLKHIDILVINALRKDVHISHMTLNSCLSVVEQVKPRRTYIIHMSHDMGLHEEVSKELPYGVQFAYDGLVVKF